MPPTALECCPDAGQEAIKAFLSNPENQHSCEYQVLQHVVLPFYHRFESGNRLPDYTWVQDVMFQLSDGDNRALLRVCTNPDYHLDLLQDLVMQYCGHLLETCGLEPNTNFNKLFEVEDLQQLIPELAPPPPPSTDSHPTIEVFEMDA